MLLYSLYNSFQKNSLKMRVLRGTIDCFETKTIPDNSVAEVSVIDCSRACGPSKTLGKVEIKNPKSFPFEYEVEFDESTVMLTYSHGFRVSCSINKDERLEFINDTAFSILDDGKILDRVDFNVIVVKRYD